MVTICFEMTELFPCQKQHADFIKLSLEASQTAWPAGSPLPLTGYWMPLALGAPGSTQHCTAVGQLQGLTQTVFLWQVFRNVDVYSRANKMKRWQPGISQKTDVSFAGQHNLHTHTHIHIYRIINCYVITPDCMPTSTVWCGGNPAF